ncbi:hypothetical protein FHG87_017008 [Trinorchestia longiramus]|nr:hypothetical protein FHG87_017008 [Trinorchestia longiramus]
MGLKFVHVCSDILDREVAAVQEWRQSGRNFHIMRDHPLHYGTKVLAGLWGAFIGNPDDYGRLRDLMFSQPVSYNKYFDQKLLQRFLWPFMQGDVVEHVSYHCQAYPGSIPFPTQRERGKYCGWGPYKIKESQIVVQIKCPEACRPKEHPQWLWC